MYINNDDLQFLIQLENKLGSAENWSDDVMQLWELIERLQAQKKKSNERIWTAIKEKRQSDPDYGRSKKEIENRERASQRREERKKAKGNKNKEV